MKIREILIWVAAVSLFAMCYFNMLQLNQILDIIEIQQETIDKIIVWQKYLFNMINSLQMGESTFLFGDFWVKI